MDCFWASHMHKSDMVQSNNLDIINRHNEIKLKFFSLKLAYNKCFLITNIRYKETIFASEAPSVITRLYQTWTSFTPVPEASWISDMLPAYPPHFNSSDLRTAEPSYQK